MTDKVKIAVIAAITVLIGIWALIYFGAHRTCVRTYMNQGVLDTHAEYYCRDVN